MDCPNRRLHIPSNQRKKLVDILLEYNKKFNCSEKVLKNIKRLHKNNCFAVVTGQQPGLLTSPLYNIYKTQ